MSNPRRPGTAGGMRFMPAAVFLAFTAFAVAGPTPVFTDSAPVAWGQLAFTPAGDLLVPKVELVALGPEEAARERARRQSWLEQPMDRAVEELVRPGPGEGEAMLRFRRWMARRYLEWARAHPQQALEGGPRRVRGVTLHVLRPSQSGMRMVASIPLWQGDAPEVSRISRHGGLGTGATETFELANVWAGAVAGSRRVAAWAWVKHGDQSPRTVVLDLATGSAPEQTPVPLEGVRPLSWTGPDALLGLTREGTAWHLVELSLDEAGGVARRRVVALAPSPNVAAIAIPGTRRALIVRGWQLSDLDLDRGRLRPLRIDGKPIQTTGTACGLPLALGGAVWLTEGPVGASLIALTPEANGWRIGRRVRLPWRMGDDPWCSPLANDPRGGLILARTVQDRRSVGSRATAAATSGWLRLYHLPAGGGLPEALPLAPVHAQWGSRPLAISPDGRWLAARMDTRDLRVWPLDALLPRH